MPNLKYSYKRNIAPRRDPHPMRLMVGRAAAAPAVRRQNQKTLDDGWKTRFKSAVNQMVDQGNYRRIALIHADMDHRMHSMNGTVGTYRFLPWHRVYLVKFEAELRLLDNTLFVPYWDWINDRTVPAWLDDLLPQGLSDLNGDPIDVTRSPGDDPDTPDLPAQPDLDGVNAQNQYVPFTSALEGIHNTVHNWVGGTMSDIMYSPCDPLFWMHHSFIDRVWASWQVPNPGQAPPLTGSDRVMDPWAETLDDALDAVALGYAYD
jgi:tyrosinase